MSSLGRSSTCDDTMDTPVSPSLTPSPLLSPSASVGNMTSSDAAGVDDVDDGDVGGGDDVDKGDEDSEVDDVDGVIDDDDVVVSDFNNIISSFKSSIIIRPNWDKLPTSSAISNTRSSPLCTLVFIH